MQIINKFREVDAKSKGIDNPNTSAGELMRELVFFILHWCFFSSSWLFSSWSKKLQISVFLLVSFLRFGAFLFLDFSRFFWFSFLFLEKSHGVGEKEFSHFSTEILWCSLGILGLSFVHLSVPSAGSSEQLCRILSRNRIEKCKFYPIFEEMETFLACLMLKFAPFSSKMRDFWARWRSDGN